MQGWTSRQQVATQFIGGSVGQRREREAMERQAGQDWQVGQREQDLQSCRRGPSLAVVVHRVFGSRLVPACEYFNQGLNFSLPQ